MAQLAIVQWLRSSGDRLRSCLMRLLDQRYVQATVMLFGCVSIAAAADEASTTIQVLNRILDSGPRFIGQPGHAAAATVIEDHLESLGGGTLIRHDMHQVVPVVVSAYMTFADGRTVPVHPLWPNGARLSSTASEGLSGRLVYLSDGDEQQLNSVDLSGTIGVLEYNSFDRWKTLFGLGVQAVLLLPPQDTTWVQSFDKFADIPFDAPRFYLEDVALAQSLRTQPPVQAVRIVSRMRWEAQPVRNLIFKVPGRDPRLQDQVVVLTARYDASCVVPQLAYGAEQAVSPAVLCEVAADLVAQPPARTAVLVWSGADTMNFASLREILGGARLSIDEHRANRATLVDKRVELAGHQLQSRSDLSTSLPFNASLRDRYLTQIKRALVSVRKQSTYIRRLAAMGERPETLLGLVRLQIRYFMRICLDAEQELLDEKFVALQRNKIESRMWEPLAMLSPAVRAQLDAEATDLDAAVLLLDQQIEALHPLFVRDRVVAVLALELTSGGPAFGIYWQTEWQTKDQFALLSRLGQRLAGRGNNAVVGAGFLSDTLKGLRDWRSDICCPLATAADVAAHFGYMSLAMVTAYDGRWLVDSPLDRRDRLNLSQVRRQVPTLRRLVRRATDEPRFRLTNRLPVRVSDISGQAVVPSPGDSRLNLGQVGRLATINSVRPIPRVVGTRWLSVQKTDATGGFRFAHQSQSSAGGGLYSVDLLGIDAAGRIVEAANQADTLQSYVFKDARSLGGEIKGVKAIMFDCAMQSVSGLRDPRYLQDLRDVRPLLQRTGDVPRYFAVRASDGVASFMLKAHRRWLVKISRGRRGVRMLMLNADPAEPLGLGFSFGRPVRSALQMSASDFFVLDQWRLDRLRRYGITGAMADVLQTKTRDHLDAAEAAGARRDRAGQLAHKRAALGLQQVVYRHVMKTGDDVVVGVIFLLVVLLPFSFYAERLFIGAVTLYGRIIGFVSIFLVMMGLLSSFHPAFRITITPIVVLLAFVIIVLSLVVVTILYMRFANQLRQASASEHSANLSRMSVISQAMLVGVSNMRRRKIRTLLTLVTLAVMTFALLSLSGTKTHLSEKRLALGVAASYPGIMVTQVGWKPMPAWFLDQIKSTYGQRALVGGQFWLIEQRPTTFTSYLVVQNVEDEPAHSHRIAALMGVDTTESAFLAADEQVHTLFRKLGADPQGCLLPATVAAAVGVVAGDSVRIHGRRFRVVATFEEASFARLRYLNGQAYGPIDLKSETKRMGQPVRVPQTEEQMLEPAHLQTAQSMKSLQPREFAVIGAGAARQMGATLHSICIRADRDLRQVIAGELARQRLVPVFVSGDRDVEVIAARAQLSMVGLGDLIVPLLIGALIVMNTMVNAVADQRGNIHVYTSLGLAPMHVGVLFLSEAAALGTLGVVGGFVLGQAFGAVARAADLIGAVTLNYSSTAAMLTMVLVMAIVLLSALYPARMAGRLAAPGESKRWTLPPPTADGYELQMALPFTVGETTARGACAFLHQWLHLHRESGVGAFISGPPSVFEQPGEDVRGVRAELWLAPFDVGVSQDVQLDITPDADGASSTGHRFYEVTISMRRLTGQRTAWLRGNRAFINELRKQFLLWRNLSPERQKAYVTMSETLLHVTATNQDRV